MRQGQITKNPRMYIHNWWTLFCKFLETLIGDFDANNKREASFSRSLYYLSNIVQENLETLIKMRRIQNRQNLSMLDLKNKLLAFSFDSFFTQEEIIQALMAEANDLYKEYFGRIPRYLNSLSNIQLEQLISSLCFEAFFDLFGIIFNGSNFVTEDQFICREVGLCHTISGSYPEKIDTCNQRMTFLLGQVMKEVVRVNPN
ncbi:MAG: hypothetical protein CEN91_228 [Candidatus Berkelbacteria bacterium Licking1014_85]|uniref:Uncharacterized protein n=1 Tax=Candidatus Berkelbacteria bacterium Licking1014_85 TaxID=2017148 RepID=A0A554LKW8_9BACT|nr:MAG: hypothetical protein CEN91_228 [Candidatus Berkelbacteria bacterium Licking1014_85]